MEILTAEMASQVHGLISTVAVPIGQAAQALVILNAIAEIANGHHVVVPASDIVEKDHGQ